MKFSIKVALGAQILAFISAVPFTYADDPEYDHPHDVRVNILDTKNFSNKDQKKLDTVIATVESVLSSEAFHQRVLNYTYQGKKQFAWNDGKTNEEIYRELMQGNESSTPGANGVVDLSVDLWTPWYIFSKALAYTTPSTKWIHLKKSYYRSGSISALADTMVHEWTHKLGFNHPYNATAERPYTVPYGVGGIVDDLASKLGN